MFPKLKQGRILMSVMLFCVISIIAILVVMQKSYTCPCNNGERVFFDERGVLEGRRDAPVKCWLLLPIIGVKIPLSQLSVVLAMSVGALLMLIGTLPFVAVKYRVLPKNVLCTVERADVKIGNRNGPLLCRRMAILSYAIGLGFVFLGTVIFCLLRSVQEDDKDVDLVRQESQ